jgi:hypothetical protein
MFFGHIYFVILDILKIFCSNKHQIITDLLNYLDPIKSNQKQEWPVGAMFINEWDLNAQSL